MTAEQINKLSPNEVIRMRNRDTTMVDCKIVYFPLDDAKTIALIEIGKSDFREIPIHFLFESAESAPSKERTQEDADNDNPPYHIEIRRLKLKASELIGDRNELLNQFCKFLEKEGYLDTDWRTEAPYAIDKFNQFLKAKAK